MEKNGTDEQPPSKASSELGNARTGTAGLDELTSGGNLDGLFKRLAHAIDAVEADQGLSVLPLSSLELVQR
jgi:hypothetical protein